ncbi:MAG: CoA-binding protein [Bacteroidota bacterium]
MLKNKPTVVIGASPSPERYSHKATFSLHKHGHTVYPVGIRKGKIHDMEIITDKPAIEDVDTVTLYVGPAHQHAWIDYIISLNPKRIIFNPGTENADFESLAESKGIETLQACTLVMLSIKEY